MKKHHKRKNNIGLDQGNFLGLFFLLLGTLKMSLKVLENKRTIEKTRYMLIWKMLKTKDFITNKGHF